MPYFCGTISLHDFTDILMTAVSCPLHGGLTGIISYGTIRATKFDAGVIKVKNNGENHLVMRQYEGLFHHAIVFLLCLWAAFQFYAVTVGAVSAVVLRGMHTLFLLLFTFLLFPAFRTEKIMRRCPPWYDVIFIILSTFCFSYFLWNYTRIAQIGGRISDGEIVIAVVAILCIFEGARRVVGLLSALALLFLTYNWWGAYLPFAIGHNGFTLKRVVLSQFWSMEGIFGTAVAVSATYIFIFIILGAFLKYAGFGRLVNDLALSFVGGTAGGPAKVSVIASGLMSMVNGSAIANVATTGTITIPLMKKTGYSKEFAAAVEAAASTGGQFTPPIMGAVAFVMAEILNVSYAYVAMAAVTPALLYYTGILLAVHLEAKKLGLAGISKAHMPDVRKVLKKEGHLLLPLVSLIGLMAVGYSPLYGATVSLVVTIIASWFRRETRMTIDKIIKATVEGTKSAITVGMCCVIIGVIIGTVTLTSLGLHLGYLILSITEINQLYIAGLFVMILSVILGMGVPGVAAYIIVQAVAVPVLVKAGAIPLVAHLFCLMYACLSNITPPVAVSAYVASGIAGGNQTKTALLAMKLGLIGFIIPFFLLYNPELLFGVPGNTRWITLVSLLTALVGTIFLVTAVENRGFCPCKPIERMSLLAAALLLLYPEFMTDAIGLILGVTVLVMQYRRKGKEI